MWSHYGNSNAGICVEFSIDIERFMELPSKTKMALVPIVYKDIRPCVRDNKLTSKYFIKHTCWQYEKELRLVIDASKELKFPKAIKYRDGLVKNIYIGTRATVGDVAKLLKALPLYLCNSQHIKFMAESTKEYELIKVELEDYEFDNLKELIYYLACDNNLLEIRKLLGIKDYVSDEKLKEILNKLYISDIVYVFRDIFCQKSLKDVRELLVVFQRIRDRVMLSEFLGMSKIGELINEK